MNHNNRKLIENKQYIQGKVIACPTLVRRVGIDPAKDKYQVRIIDSYGVPVGMSFSFPNSYNRYHNIMWRKVRRYIGEPKRKVIFAVETACDLWQTLVHCLYTNRPLLAKAIHPASPLSYS
ncbi:MAG: hypothetical protein ACE5EE_05420 [Fidelibacterota bacterium]